MLPTLPGGSGTFCTGPSFGNLFFRSLLSYFLLRNETHIPLPGPQNPKSAIQDPLQSFPATQFQAENPSNRVWAAPGRLQFTDVPKWSAAHVTTRHICFVPRGQRTLTRQFHGCNRFWRCKLRYPALTLSFQRKPSLCSLLLRPLCSRVSQHSMVTASGTLWLHPPRTRALPVSLSNRRRRKPEIALPPCLLARVMPYFLSLLLLGQIQ